MNCPTCDAPQPHLHPAVQCGGEVEICRDAFHLTPTPMNKPEWIAAVREKQSRAADSNALDNAASTRNSK